MNLPSQSFLVSDVKKLETKAQKPYLAFKAGDNTGNIECVWWDYATADEGSQNLVKDGALVDLGGQISKYKEKLQFKVSGLRAGSDTDMTQFEKRSKYDELEMWNEFLGYAISFKHKYFREVASLIVLQYKEQFISKPAATGMHHAFKHGLLEHTLQMIKTGEKIFELPFYSEELNWDLCMFGLMFHDFGKIFEYGDAPGFKKTISGVKVPHIPKTAAIIYHKCQELQVPDIVCDEMMSVVLSHHRFLEWGSPVTPSSPEALFVHYVDNLHGDVFGCLQKLADDTSGDDRVKQGFGTETCTLPKKRINDILMELEVQDESIGF